MALTIVMPETTLPLDLESKAAAASRMSEEEFRAFYDRTARPVWAYLVRITSDPPLADDLLQEAYYRLYRAGTVYENESHRRNSLFRIATNLARDSGRKKRRGIDVEIPEELHAVNSHPDERTDLTRALGRPAARNEVSTARSEEVAVVQELELLNGEEFHALVYSAPLLQDAPALDLG